jgi:hypothetical protein
MVGELIGTVGGDIIGSGDRRKARRAMEAALADIANTNAEAGPSAYEDLKSDPALRAAQIGALRRLEREGAEGGMGLQSRVALNEAAGDVSRRERGSREAILQQMAMRGNAGGGASLAANLTNQQGSADRNAAFGARAAADARARALQATSMSGNLAGGIRGQDWGEGSDRAGNLDALSRFNASSRLTKAGMMANVRVGQANQSNADADRWTSRGAGIGAGYDAWETDGIDPKTGDPKKRGIF